MNNASHERTLKQQQQKKKKKKKKTLPYLSVEHQVPCFATEDVLDGYLDKIKRDVEHKAVQPYHPGPAPSNRADGSEADVCVDGNDGSRLAKSHQAFFLLNFS
jgi:hypothetical protein